jgi:hypothetical protein
MTQVSSVDSKFGDEIQKNRNSGKYMSSNEQLSSRKHSSHKLSTPSSIQSKSGEYKSASGSADLPPSPSTTEQKSGEYPSFPNQKKKNSDVLNKRKVSVIGVSMARFSKLYEHTSDLFEIFDASEKEILLLVAKDVFMRFKMRSEVQQMLSRLKPKAKSSEEIQIAEEIK